MLIFKLMRNPKFKLFFYVLIVSQLLLAHINLAYAQTNTPIVYGGVEQSIKDYLCAPTDASKSAVTTTYFGTNISNNPTLQNNAAGNDLFNCINKLYRFAIAAGSVVSIMFIVIAGYLYMNSAGNQESVDKAKSIFESSIVSMVILFGGYILLRAINPDLLQFQTVTPPSVGTVAPWPGVGSGGGVTGPGIPSGCTTTTCVFQGYNIGPYATSPTHEITVIQVYGKLSGQDFSSAASIDQVLKSMHSNTPLTGAMVFTSAQSLNVDPRLMVALMQTDSQLGTAGLGVRTKNPGNVGNTDSGATRTYNTWDEGVRAVAQWLSNHRG